MSLSLVTRHLSNFCRAQQYRTIPAHAKVRFSTNITPELEFASKEIADLKGRIEKLEQSKKGKDNSWSDEDLQFFDRLTAAVSCTLVGVLGFYLAKGY